MVWREWKDGVLISHFPLDLVGVVRMVAVRRGNSNRSNLERLNNGCMAHC